MKLIKFSLQATLVMLLLNSILQAHAYQKTFKKYNPQSEKVLQHAFQNRYLNPKRCISLVKKYINNRPRYNNISRNKKILSHQGHTPTVLLAFCHVQLDQYSKAVKLLTPF